MSREDLSKLEDCLWVDELARQSGIDSRLLRQLYKIWPDPGSLRQAQSAQIVEAMPDMPARIIRLRSALKDTSWRQRVVRLAAEAAAMGIRAVFSGDADYPARLKEISGCPLVLYYRGEHYRQVFQQEFFVTMIGTRTPTAYGRIVTERMARELAENKIVIVSGMARGIDSVAHKAALGCRGQTIAVVGNGPDIPYPPEHAGLMEKIAETGVVISEHPPGTPPRKQHFPARNRILSGLADAVAVMEASRQSGTLITTSFAADQGRDVFAVPGNILSPQAQGCNQLIADGAYVLQTAKDLLWRLPSGSLQTRIEQWLKQNTALVVQNDASQSQSAKPGSKIIDLLAAAPLTLASVADKLDMSIGSTSVILTGLEMEGLVYCQKGRYALTEAALCSI